MTGNIKKESPYETLRKSFEISTAEVKEIIKNLNEEMERGLAGEPSSVLMLPSFVEPPTGNETGKFLSVDFGGTNLRVLSLDLEGNGRTSAPIMENYTIKNEVRNGTKEDLFGFIAEKIADFLRKNRIDSAEARKIGFTFSFAVEQTGVASGKLISWSKDFAVKDAIGEDVALMLGSALEAKRISNLEIAALANDTVGVLANGRFRDNDCDVGMVLGTGVNAAYSEVAAKIRKAGIDGTASGKMMVNTECCEFTRMRQTDFDKALDRATENPNEATLEKMVSGKYLGRLAGLIISDFWDKKEFSYNLDIFDSNSLKAFDSQAMSEVISDASPDLGLVGSTIGKFGVVGATQSDRQMIKDICQLVFSRSTRVAAAALAAIILKIDPELEQPHAVAFDGSLYEKAFGYKESLFENLDSILGGKTSKIRFLLAKDGSGIGASIMAAASH